jgi:starch phosphorylase
VFLENYDMSLARVMVQGVDVWLNNPLRLHEASGTSGMKVPANGGLNLSCLDGWWPEAYNGENGWAIGDGRVYDDLAYQDHVESESLYNLLEREIIPLFYERTADDCRAAGSRMKASMRTICPQVQHDTACCATTPQTKMYLPDTADVLKVGDEMGVRARVHLGSIAPEDVVVEAYYGPLQADSEIHAGQGIPLSFTERGHENEFWFEGRIPCRISGRNGYAIRVLPCHADLSDRYDQGLVVWG